MKKSDRGKKIRNIAISFIALASMLLTGCSTLFGGSIKGGTKLDEKFGPYEEEVHFVKSTRGKIDVRLNFDGEYEGSKYASSYPDAFYISPELSNSTDDIEYFQFLGMIDNRYTVYCYQTLMYKDGKKRSDEVKTSKDTDEDAYIMYPEVVVDEKYEVNQDELYTVFAVYDYTKGNESGYREIGRWSCEADNPAAFCFSKLGYTKDDTGKVVPKHITICTTNNVYNYRYSDIVNFAKNGGKFPADNVFSVDLDLAFNYFLNSPENQRTSTDATPIIAKNQSYELEVYNVACKTDANGTYIYLDMTASTQASGKATAADEAEVEAAYYNDDPTGDAPESEYDDADDDDELDEEDEWTEEEEAQAEAEAQAATGSFDFICSIVDCYVGDSIRVFSGPTESGKYSVEFYNGVTSSINTMYSHVMEAPKLNKYYKMADYDGNAPFIAVAIYETFDVCGFTYTGKDEEGDEHSFENELDWKKLNNKTYDDADSHSEAVEDLEDEYWVAWDAEEAYHTYLNDLTGTAQYRDPRNGNILWGDRMGLTKRDPVPIGGIKYSQTGARQNKVTEFPVTLYGKWSAWDDPYYSAKRRVMGRDKVDSIEFSYKNVVLDAVSFTNMSADDNSFETLCDDVIIGWDGNRIYNKPKSISSVYYLPESFSEIFSKDYGDLPYPGRPSWCGPGIDPYPRATTDMSSTQVNKLKEVNFLVTDISSFVLAVKDGEVLATPGSTGYDANNTLKINTKNFTQTVSEATENSLKINTDLSGSSSEYWSNQDIDASSFDVDASYKNGVTAGIFEVYLNVDGSMPSTNYDTIKKEMRQGNDEDATITCIIASDGVHFDKANGAALTDVLSYDVIDKIINESNKNTLKTYLKSDVLINNWNSGVKLAELVRENLRYRYQISFTEKNSGAVEIKIAEAKVDSAKTAKTFSVSAPKADSKNAATIESQVAKKDKEYAKFFGADYWNSIRQYILDTVQVDKKVYTKYKKVKNSNYSVIGAENLDYKNDAFDGSKNKQDWWVCTTALYGLGFQESDNAENFFIPTFQRVQHKLNTTSVYDEEDVFKDTKTELETSVVSLKNGIACYGIYDNIQAAKDKKQDGMDYPYVFIGFDNQGNVYTESEVCRAKVIPFGFTGENYSKTVTAGNKQLTLDVKKSGDDTVIYYLKDSWVNENGQEIIFNNLDADNRDAELDKVTGRIHGTVTDLEGKGVEGFTAELMGPLTATAYTYAEGTFGFRRLTEGTYILNEIYDTVDIATASVKVGEAGKIEKVSIDDYYKCEADSSKKGNDAYINLTNFEGVDEIDKISGRIMGYVFNEKGAGVKNVTATISGPVEASEVTSAAGAYSARRLTEGVYTVTETYNKVDIATFEVEIGPTGEIENIEVTDYYNCEPETKISGKTAFLILNNFKGAKYSEDEFTGRIHTTVKNGKGIAVKGITTTVTGPINATAKTSSGGTSTIKRLDKGTYFVSQSYYDNTLATYKVVVGPRGKMQSIEALTYNTCTTSVSTDGNEAYIEITGDPNIDDWPSGGPSRDKSGKDKKGISNNDRKKKTTPKDVLDERDPGDIIDEYLSGNDVSGNVRKYRPAVSGNDPNGRPKGNPFVPIKPTGANGETKQSFWEWILSHLGLVGPILLIILFGIGYMLYKMKGKGKLGLFDKKKKKDRKDPLGWIKKYFKPM